MTAIFTAPRPHGKTEFDQERDLISVSLGDSVQLSQLDGGFELDVRLLKDPGFDTLMMHTQQIERTHAVMLLGGRTGLVPHQLRHHARWQVQPFGALATSRA